MDTVKRRRGRPATFPDDVRAAAASAMPDFTERHRRDVLLACAGRDALLTARNAEARFAYLLGGRRGLSVLAELGRLCAFVDAATLHIWADEICQDRMPMKQAQSDLRLIRTHALPR